MIWMSDEKVHAVPQEKVDSAHAIIEKWKESNVAGCCIAYHALEIMRILGLEGGDLIETAQKT